MVIACDQDTYSHDKSIKRMLVYNGILASDPAKPFGLKGTIQGTEEQKLGELLSSERLRAFTIAVATIHSAGTRLV